MENVVYAGITVVILIVWYFLQGKVMATPYDIYRKWQSDVAYIPPEDPDLKLVKTQRAIKRLEEIFEAHGPWTDAGREAVECLQQLRRAETALRMQR